MPRTLMAVHAHPDDEVISTGGTLATYAAAGATTVLVTCTNGDQGDGPGGVKPDEPGHDPELVAATRAAELRASADLLGITHVELLGYPDSGIEGWSRHTSDTCFSRLPVDGPAARLAALIERYRPDVVVTYDETGVSGHPDHIRTHEVTVAALALLADPPPLYVIAIPLSRVKAMQQQAADDPTGERWAPPEGFGTPDELISVVVDVARFAETKKAALAVHASQSDAAFILALEGPALVGVLGREAFVRVGQTAPPVGVSPDFP